MIGHMREEMERLAAPEDTRDDEQNGETNPQCKTNKGMFISLIKSSCMIANRKGVEVPMLY